MYIRKKIEICGLGWEINIYYLEEKKSMNNKKKQRKTIQQNNRIERGFVS